MFGSRADGTASKESDYDFVLVSKEFQGKKFYERPAKLYLDWNFDAPADFICLTPEEFEEKARRPTIIREAVRHGINLT